MSAPNEFGADTSSGGPSRIVRVALWFLLVVILILFALPLLASGRIETFVALALGWIQFLKRTVPRITWNWDLVGMGVVCSAAILIAAHWFLNWVASFRAAARGEEFRWPWKWTVSGLMATGICFLVGMSVGGIAHQVGWLCAQTERWYERKGGVFNDLQSVLIAFQSARGDANDEVVLTRQLMRTRNIDRLGDSRDGGATIDRFHVLVMLDWRGKIAGSIIFPRDTNLGGGLSVVYSPEGRNEYLPMEKLPELLEKHRKDLLAL